MKKQIINGYLIAVGEGIQGVDITTEEYNAILATISNKPMAGDGYDYRLTESLEWERYEIEEVAE